MDILKWTASALILVAILYGSFGAFGAWRWNGATCMLVSQLNAAEIADGAMRYDARVIADLPAPVRRNFEKVLTDGRGVITAPVFLLVPQVRLPKRLDLARDAERAIDRVPSRIVVGWLSGDQSR